MKRDVVEFISKCLTCQKVKAEHQRPGGELQPIEIPKWKWEQISMDFVVGLPKTTNGHDSIWVIVDRLTKSAHFIPIRVTYSLEQLAELYVKEIVRLHGVPKSIISDRDARFTSSYQATIGAAPYEALYGRKCRSPVHWYEVGESLVVAPDFVEATTEAVKKIRARMETAQSRQKSYADKRRRPLEFQEGDFVFLKKYVPDASHVLESEPVEMHEDLSYEEGPVQILDRKMKTLRNKDIPLVKVLWRNHNFEEATWEREDVMKSTYPDLF
ncbi:hypothetical protein UlMin_041321 [Ulmus minor]